MAIFEGVLYNSKADIIRHLANKGLLTIDSPGLKNMYALELGITPQTIHATLKAMNEGKKSLTKKPFTMADVGEIPVLVRQKIVDKVQWCFEQTKSLLSNPDMPKMEWNLRGAAAGKYKHGGSYGRLGCLCWHPKLVVRNEENYIEQTVPHEVAHYIVRQVWGDVQSHGTEWKQVMKMYGLTPERTHSYDVSGIKQDRSPFVYNCGCREIKVGHKRHNKIQRGRNYICILCKSRLSFVMVEERA